MKKMTMILVMMMTMVISISAKNSPNTWREGTRNHSGVVVKHKGDKHNNHGRCVCFKDLKNKKYKNAKAWRKAMDKHMKKCNCRCHYVNRKMHRR
jgi:hypothetical protein